MSVRQQDKAIWIVVLVESGVPTAAEAYIDEETAIIREQFLREDINLDYVDVGIFEVEIGEAYAL